MKKLMTSLLVLSSFSTLAINMDSMKISGLDTKSKTNYTSLITRVKLEKSLTLDLTIDDDLYFQGGKVVTEQQIDKTQSFCQLDTDVESKAISGTNIIVAHGVLSMKKGLIRAIERVEVSPKFEKGLIEYDINFIRSVVSSTNEVVDELECSVPLTVKKALTVADVKKITGNAFSFDILNIEQ